MAKSLGIHALMASLLIAALFAGCLGEEDPPDAGQDDPGSEAGANETGPAPVPNEAVSGMNDACLDSLVLYEYPEAESPLAETFSVEENTLWEASTSESGVHVEFFTEGGEWTDHGDDSGTVPSGSAYGIACAVDGAGAPVPAGEWTYQDGF